MTTMLEQMKKDRMEIAAIKSEDGTPHYYAVTPDQLTSIELTGEPEHLTRLALVGVMSRKHLVATSRNGAWAALLLAFALPNWKDGQKWLAGRVRALQTAPNVQLTMYGWRIALTYTAKTGMMTMQLTRI